MSSNRFCALMVLSALVGSCASTHSPRAQPPPDAVGYPVDAGPPPPQAPPIVASTGAALAAHLIALAVSDDDFYRPILYTWTSPSSIAAVRDSRQLLVATATSGAFMSPFNRTLLRMARRPGAGQAMARALLDDPRLARRRYAWPAPFATVMGIGDRTYGTALIRIELRADAWIGRFDPFDVIPFRFVDAAGQTVALTDVLATPERVAAIFHVRTEARQAVKFREYVVCNEAMVASWSIATDVIAAEVAAERELLRTVRDPMQQVRMSDLRSSAITAWPHGPQNRSWLALWHAALAFDNDRYRPDRTRLEAIDHALADYDPAGSPITITP
jgi:hypothetical protein